MADRLPRVSDEVSLATRLPVGVRDFLPRAAARRRAIAEALLAEFERWGYERLITPAFEYADVLERGLGKDSRQAALRFVEPATGEVVALRPDITPQVARVAATRLADVAGALRLCYEGSVLRLLPGARGQRELIQAGIELVGVAAPDGDGEVLGLALAALGAVGLADATLDVGHVALVRAALDGIDDPAQRAELALLVARKDRAGVAHAAAGLPPRRRRLLDALPDLAGAPDDVLRRARLLPLDAACRAALDDLARALELAHSTMPIGSAPAQLALDLGETRGFDYYTGIRFAGYVAGAGDALLRGGRYDDLVARFGRDACATGFAVDVEQVAQAQKQRGAAVPAGAPLVLVVERGTQAERGFALACALRGRGLRAATELGGGRTDALLLEHARALGARAVLLVDGRSARVHDLACGTSRVAAAAAVAGAVRGDGQALVRELALGPVARKGRA